MKSEGTSVWLQHIDIIVHEFYQIYNNYADNGCKAGEILCRKDLLQTFVGEHVEDECINKMVLCDGIKDCARGEDEQDSICRKYSTRLQHV